MKRSIVIIYILCALIMVSVVLSIGVEDSGASQNPITNNQPSYPSSPSDNTWMDNPNNPMHSPPPNPVSVNGARLKDYQGLDVDGNRIRFDSVSSVYSAKFVFNDVENGNIEVDDGMLLSAEATSSKDNNVLVIKNPLDSLEIEKIKVYLNKTQTLTYKYDSENVSIAIPAQAKIVVVKGSSKNITIEPDGAASEIVMSKETIGSFTNRYGLEIA